MKKVMIFTCAGGGGHLAASGAFEQYLRDSYQVKVVNIFTEVLPVFDVISLLTRGHYSYEKFYNMLIRHRYVFVINIIYPLGRFYYWLMQRRMGRAVERYIREHKPDMVISVVVLMNRAIFDACKAANIPFLLSTTDLEPQAFLVKMSGAEYSHFRINVPFYDEKIIKKITDQGISLEKILFLGFPLRPAFFQTYDCSVLRKKYEFDTGTPLVLISMGAQGSTGLIHAVNALKELPIPAQLVVTLGKSSNLRGVLEAIVLPPWISCTIVENTIPMAELMAMADVAVIKAGSTTFCEAIQMGCPLLLDGTQTPPIWERFNHTFVKRYRIGSCFKRYEQLPCLVERCVLDEVYCKQMRKNLAVFKRFDPASAFNELINELSNQVPERNLSTILSS